MTLDEDGAEVERVAVGWQAVPDIEQETMLAGLGKMLEYQLRRDAERLMRKIEDGLGR